MFRITLSKALSLPSAPISRLTPCNALCRAFSDKAPEKIEVFIDDKSVHVLPGTTVLQVCKFIIINLYFILNTHLNCVYRLPLKSVWKFLDSVIMSV